MIKSNYLLSISFFMLALFLFATLDAIAKLLVQTYPVPQVIFLRFFTHTVIAAIILTYIFKKKLFYNPFNIVNIIRSSFLGIATIFNFLALQYLPLTVTGTMFFLAPFFVVIMSIIFFKEKVGWRRWLAMIIAFAAIGYIMKPGTALFQPAILLSLGASISYALYQILVRFTLNNNEPQEAMAFHSGLVPACLLCPVVMVTDIMIPSDYIDYGLWLAIGVLGFLGQFFIIYAIKLTSGSVLAPFQYPQIIFMTFYSYALFQQVPTTDNVVGAIIIISCGLYVWSRERKFQK